MTRSVVTGAAGFLGSHLVERLLREGHEVVGVDTMITGNLDNLEGVQSHPRFSLVRHDVTQPLYVQEKVDLVWHLASPASPPDYLAHPIHTMKVGALGTHNMLGVALKHQARLLLASSSEVYGDPQVWPQPEAYWGHVNPIGPRAVYDEAKRFAESLVMAYRRRHGLGTRIARIFNTYGPGMRLDDGRVVPNFIGQALRGEPLTIYGNGTQTRSFCYVSDTIEGLWRLMGTDYDQPVNLGSPEERTVLQLAEAVRQASSSDLPLVFKPLPIDDPRRRCPDISVARKILNWQPLVPLEDGLRRVLAHFSAKVARMNRRADVPP